MKSIFYDIESLSNVFTLCSFHREDNRLEVYYLCDDDHLTSDPNFKQIITDKIREKNKNLTASTADGYCDIFLFDLKEPASNDRLAATYGLCDAAVINNPKMQNNYPPNFRITCTTDPDYNENDHPYLFGYNSFNYDTTMLALYLYDTYHKNGVIQQTNPYKTPVNVIDWRAKPPTAKKMREYNNVLFDKQFRDNMPSLLTHAYDIAHQEWRFCDYNADKAVIRRNMLLSGRHIDVARLNEKQQKVALKRLLGMLGYQILESDKLHGEQTTIHTLDEFAELIAYNASDVINLYWLFQHQVYQGQFTLKKGLLDTYPELIYERKAGEYKPNISQYAVRKNRLTIDSSSAKFATQTLCPYDNLDDIPVVSYLYPTKEKADEFGIKQVDVLEEAKAFFYSKFPQPDVRAQFDRIYAFYDAIRGKNFNGSKNYQKRYGGDKTIPMPLQLKDIPKTDCQLPYFDKDGNPTSCFVTFSTGGIHGAEINTVLWQHDLAIYNKAADRLAEAQKLYPAPEDLKKAKRVTLSDGVEYPAGQFLKSGSTLKKSYWKTIKKPELFRVNKNGVTELNKKYAYTSADAANHEDFTSYYPNLLRMMEAFYNPGLGEDRYARIFFQKQDYGKKMKDKTLSEKERAFYSVLREGTKLILNSASGAGDTNFESNIRMNNTIISMRIIGQLFSWRIGQAQTLEGAKITSTNTDGLYSVLESSLNDQILARESKDIGVEIEPEPIYLISKDSNNRLEYDETAHKIISASGGSLACYKGPNPTKALAHPAILDWATCEYLIAVTHGDHGLNMTSPFDDELGMSILKQSFQKFNNTKWLLMFQNVIASSIGSVNYIFGTEPDDPKKLHILQHYNRVFIMKDGTPNTMHLHAAAARKITPAIRDRRRRENEPAIAVDPVAFSVLSANGIKSVPPGTDAVIKKITKIEESWHMMICNKDLYTMNEEEVNFIKENIDLEKYLALLRDSFEENWRNATPDSPKPTNENNESEDGAA